MEIKVVKDDIADLKSSTEALREELKADLMSIRTELSEKCQMSVDQAIR